MLSDRDALCALWPLGRTGRNAHGEEALLAGGGKPRQEAESCRVLSPRVGVMGARPPADPHRPGPAPSAGSPLPWRGPGGAVCLAGGLGGGQPQCDHQAPLGQEPGCTWGPSVSKVERGPLPGAVWEDGWGCAAKASDPRRQPRTLPQQPLPTCFRGSPSPWVALLLSSADTSHGSHWPLVQAATRWVWRWVAAGRPRGPGDALLARPGLLPALQAPSPLRCGPQVSLRAMEQVPHCLGLNTPSLVG